MSGRSTVSHYETMDPSWLLKSLRLQSHELVGQNIVGEGAGEKPGANDEDVPDQFFRLAEGKGLRSRLAWHDTLRNVRVFEDCERQEPTLFLDIGCGISHPLGRFVAARELDTYYVGLDFVDERVRAVAATQGVRTFAGIRHDNREPLPLEDDVVDFCACLAAVTQWVHSRDQMGEFLEEVHRVCKPGATFWLSTPNIGRRGAPLQHPHCHEFEFSHDELMATFQAHDFDVEQYFNYRARPAEMQRLRTLQPGYMYDWTDGLPEALRDGIELGMRTFNAEVVPGNVLYRLTTS